MKITRALLGARIKELRRARHLTQEQLSERINIDPKHLSRLEVGRSYPSLDTLENIRKELKVEMKEFFEFEHRVGRKKLIDRIIVLMKQTDEEKLRFILKIVRAAMY